MRFLPAISLGGFTIAIIGLLLALTDATYDIIFSTIAFGLAVGFVAWEAARREDDAARSTHRRQ